MSKLISVIVPIYNVEGYLEKCIKSIMGQTYENLQIVLVDDGSTDSSRKICDKYKMLDSRIEVIHQKNGGLVKARKAGLRVAKGDYIGFVDGDDYIEKEMYERMVEYISKNNADFIHSGYLKNDESDIRGTGKYREVLINDENKALEINNLIFDMENGQVMSPCLCFKLFKNEIIKNAYNFVPDEQSYGEDLIALCRAICVSKKILIVNEAYYHYLVREDSIMNNINRDSLIRENDLRLCLQNLANEIGEYEKLKDKINIYWLTGILDDLKKILPENVRIFNCSLINKLRGKKIVLYGAGAVGNDYYSQLRLYIDIDIVAWVDKNSKNIRNKYYDVSSIDNIKKYDFDYLIIAVLSESQAEKIINELSDMGIDSSKVLWQRPVMTSTL